MGLRYELADEIDRAEVIVHGVMVHGVVTVVVGIGAPGFVAVVYSAEVLVPGSDPQGGHSQLLKVRQMVDDPPQVTPVPTAGFVPSDCFRRRAARAIVGGIAVAEAVEHDQVDHIVLIEPLGECRDARVKRRLKLEGDRGGAGHCL